MDTANQLIHELHIINISEDQQEALIGISSLIGIQAIEQRDTAILIYHDDQEYLHQQLEEIKNYATWLKNDQVAFKARQNQNWNQLWEESFTPIVIDDFCAVRASWHDTLQEVEHTVVIDPEMAFGTGHHETTYMMIHMMRELHFTNTTVLDYGSGTAILSILAEKLGAKSIDAIDIDDQATLCAKKCLLVNNAQNITCFTGIIHDIQDTSPYEIILANINRNVLLETAADIASRQKKGGDLLLSGVLAQDRSIIMSAYEAQSYGLIKEMRKGDWLCIHLRKR